MINNKKEQEREELHHTIWGMENYRYISENFEKYVNDGEAEAGNRDFKYSELSDEDAKQAKEYLVKL